MRPASRPENGSPPPHSGGRSAAVAQAAPATDRPPSPAWPSPAAAARPDADPRPPAIVSLTAIRGVAAVWVVLFHFQSDLIGLIPASRPLRPLLERGSLAVPMFFVLSGYVLAMNHAAAFGRRVTRAGVRDFYLRRLVRIYPLHLATLLGLVAMRVGLRLFRGEDVGALDWENFVPNLLLVHMWLPDPELSWNGPSWSISSEWFAYLLFPAAAAALWRAGRRANLAAACLGLAGMIGFYLNESSVPFPGLTVIAGPFLLGVSARLAWEFGSSSAGGAGRAPGWTIWAGAATVALGAFLPNPRWSLAVTLTGLASLVVLLGAAGPNCPRPFRWPALTALGEASYALYLVHGVVYQILFQLLPAERYFDAGWLTRLAVVAAYVLATAAATWLAQATVERRIVPRLRALLTARRRPAA